MNAEILITLLLGAVDRAAAYSATLNKAKAEGRDVSDAELDQAFDDDLAERARGQAIRDRSK